LASRLLGEESTYVEVGEQSGSGGGHREPVAVQNVVGNRVR
jgi:hypothetical protein